MRLTRPDQGSVLALVPAGLLVLIVLAALSVDSAVSYLGQRQLHDAVSAAANDAATAGIDNRSFYAHGTVTLDPAAVSRMVCSAFAAQNASGLHDVRLWVSEGDNSVRVVGEARVDAVFARALPGIGSRTVRSSAAAVVTSRPLGGESMRGSVGPLSQLSCAGVGG